MTSAPRLALPHGSFTNHFRSKETFAKKVLDRYFDSVQVWPPINLSSSIRVDGPATDELSQIYCLK